MTDVQITVATPADARAIAMVQIATWHSTYRGIVPDPYLTSMSLETNEQRWIRILHLDREHPAQRITLVARSETAGVVGFLSGGPERDGTTGYPGEVYAIYVAEEFQGLGTGGRLLREGADKLAARDLSPFLVWVLSDNPFRKFYERHGGVPLHHKTVEIGGKELEETAYGFSTS